MQVFVAVFFVKGDFC